MKMTLAENIRRFRATEINFISLSLCTSIPIENNRVGGLPILYAFQAFYNIQVSQIQELLETYDCSALADDAFARAFRNRKAAMVPRNQ